jgi:hypothetical protein
MKDLDELLEEIYFEIGAGRYESNEKEHLHDEKFTLDRILLNTNEIVKTIEAIKLGDPTKVEQTIQKLVENEKYVMTDSVENMTEIKNIKKIKNTYRRDNKVEDINLEEYVSTNLEENIYKWKSYFDFSTNEINSTLYPDNSLLSIINNSKDLQFNQMYYYFKIINK